MFTVPESIMKPFLSSFGGTLGLKRETPSAIALQSSGKTMFKGNNSYKPQTFHIYRCISNKLKMIKKYSNNIYFMCSGVVPQQPPTMFRRPSRAKL